MTYKALDLFCKAGGVSMGLHRAGFDVTGVDIESQPNYPFRFIQADALTFDLSGYDFIAASPMCQAHSWSARRWKKNWPDQIPAIRERLIVSGKPYIIENVVGAPLISPLTLCGTMFGLKVFRHRLFESNLPLMGYGCSHKGKIGFGPDDFCTVAGHGGNGKASLKAWREAMGIDWMTKDELTQAIPPAYSEYLGRQVIAYLDRLKLAA